MRSAARHLAGCLRTAAATASQAHLGCVKAQSALSIDLLYAHRGLPAHSGPVWPRNQSCGLSTGAPSYAADAIREFRLAQTGEGIKECELVQWYVREGDAVEEFGRVCAVQSDKATIEITSPFAGVVKRLRHAPGGVVQVGDVLADIQGALRAGEDLEADADAAEPTRVRPRVSSREGGAGVGPGSSTGILTSPAVRALSRELAIDLTAVPGTGPGGRVTKGDVLALADSLGLGAATPSAAQATAPNTIPVTEEPRVAAAADVRPGGQPSALEGPRVAAAADVRPGGQPSALEGVGEAPAAQAQGVGVGAAPPAKESIVVPLRGYRRIMVRSMTAAGAIPHFHMSDDVQLDAIVALRQRLRDAAALRGAKLTYLPFFLKAAAIALAEFPLLNSSLAPDAASLLQHGAANIGVAIATPQGLVVPNIKDVGAKSVADIAQELARLSVAANANQLRPEDVRGGTFTISNIGSVGGTYASPLVNPPEVAIMALGRMQVLPRMGADGGTVVPAHIMGVSLGADHRVVDGAAMAGFVCLWKQLVEEPGQLLLSLR